MKNNSLTVIFSLLFFMAYGQEKHQRQLTKTKNSTMENKMKVEIWSDIMCPFCYIGKRNFEKALAQFPNKELIEVEWKSFQIDPAMPEVPKYQDDMYMFVADRKGMTYEQSKARHQDLIQYAESVGLEYNLDKALVTNSMKGHRIIQFAKNKGLGEKAEETFFYAYFTQGKNLNDQITLIELGKEIGLTENEVNTALTEPLYVQKVESDSLEAQTLGAKGVPFFVVNRKYAIAGAQQPNDILQTLERSFSEWQKENLQTTLETIHGKICSTDGECN
ncbi:DsbA family oxidoreductase [Chryseobacterium sp.]|uniref:DsbA family oxidoreductase n=1 Tax=Chryseobacterium sp. TaxID=1871047 RepID=UPI00345B41A7